jgi:signal transduction histidine kinase
MNLIANARKSVEDSGKPQKRVVVSTFMGQTGRGELGAAVIEVSDNGLGVPKELEQRIFEPFFTTKRPGEGTGLGLSIARRIIEEHQGRIALVNREGEGVTFRIALPAYYPEEEKRGDGEVTWSTTS